MSVPQPQQLSSWPGRAVSDSSGERIGFCGAVLGERRDRPGWLLLYGLPDGQARVAPLQAARAAEDRLVLGVPYGRVAASPPVRQARDLGAQALRRQRTHYGLPPGRDPRRGALAAALLGVPGAAAAGAALSWRAGREARETAAAVSSRRRRSAAGRSVTARGAGGTSRVLGLVLLIWRAWSLWRSRRSGTSSRRRYPLVRTVVFAWRTGVATARLLRRLYRFALARRRSRRTSTGSTSPTPGASRLRRRRR